VEHRLRDLPVKGIGYREVGEVEGIDGVERPWLSAFPHVSFPEAALDVELAEEDADVCLAQAHRAFAVGGRREVKADESLRARSRGDASSEPEKRSPRRISPTSSEPSISSMKAVAEAAASPPMDTPTPVEAAPPDAGRGSFRVAEAETPSSATRGPREAPDRAAGSRANANAYAHHRTLPVER
jgi:hypothetical protein